ncbi:MAG: NAD-dependent epimerase/dehydratase family protein [Spirochaetales bacterium]|jgi:nucleoside-diphosphate-sugar epimerase|nr:NAD-dependent epimerase/dehydratase family protein [Spirochaetales bacterium]
MTAKKILVIGGTGHVSGAVAKLALSRGHQVWTLTRGIRPAMPGAIPIIVDRADSKALKIAIRKQNTVWDLVVDCICFNEPEMKLDIELFSSRAKQFVFVSTDFVYDPEKRKLPRPESGVTLEPGESELLSYGREKRACELELMKADTGVMSWTVFRPCHVYGPTSELGCLPHHGRDPKLIEKLRAGEPIRLVGGGYFLQQPIMVSDLAESLLSVIGNSKSHNEIFNAAGPDIVESREYYQIIADLLSVKLTVKEMSVQAFLTENPDSSSFTCHRIYDLSKMEAAGIAKPSTSIKDGLRLHVEGLEARRPG